MNKKSLLIFGFLLIALTAFSQTEKFIDSGSVKNQFDYLINNSNNMYESKVVKQQWLVKLKSNVADSLMKSKNIITITKNNIEIQKQEIDSLNTSLLHANELIDTLSNEQEQMSLLGIGMSKTTFKTFVYSLILLLATLFVVFLLKFRQSNSITKEAKTSLLELEEEFNEHRTKALEREQVAMRKLQDELNKQKRDF